MRDGAGQCSWINLKAPCKFAAMMSHQSAFQSQGSSATCVLCGFVRLRKFRTQLHSEPPMMIYDLMLTGNLPYWIRCSTSRSV